MIEVAGLSKTYDERVAVRDLSFTVQAGEVLGLVGPNGAGKTTTMRAIAGIHSPTGGTLRIAGHDVVREAVVRDERELRKSFDQTSQDEFLARAEETARKT